MPLSGSSQSLGKELLSGAELYFEHINKKGRERPAIEWVVYDDNIRLIRQLRTQFVNEKDQVDILFSMLEPDGYSDFTVVEATR